MVSPFEYHNNQLGVKIAFLISDRNKSNHSLNLISYRALKKRMDSEKTIEKQLRKASYSYQALVLFSSLSQEWRNKITITFGEPEKELKKSWFQSHFLADKDAYDYYVSYRYGENNNKVLTPEQIEQYTNNASVINTVLKLKANRKAYAKALGVKRLDIWESLSRDVNHFSDVAHNLPTNKDSLRRKIKSYENSDNKYHSLISGKLQNNNAKKVFRKEQKALLDELLSKHTNLDNELVATMYNAVADQLGYSRITAGTVSNRKKQSSLITYAGRNGTKQLKNNILMQHKRSKPSKPMLYWSLDGWDAELLYQSTKIDGRGYKTTTYHNRLSIIVVLDPFNKYPIGYAIGDNESPRLIKKALQNAFNHTKELLGGYFRPYQLQTDNYQAKNLEPLYKSCTVVHTPAAVGNAKAKIVEPYFNQIKGTSKNSFFF